MDKLMLYLNIIVTVATVISTVIAIKSKNEAKEILKEIKVVTRNQNVDTEKNEVHSDGNNTGIIVGINSGDITNGK